jgi:hypothetical protein
MLEQRNPLILKLCPNCPNCPNTKTSKGVEMKIHAQAAPEGSKTKKRKPETPKMQREK